MVRDNAVVEVQVRLLSDDDSIPELTALLHRSYARLANLGLRFVATYQDDATTLERVQRGECFVALLDGKFVGTICYYPADRTDGCPWYDRPEVASFGQFGVEPGLQGKGIGEVLLAKVEERARATGARELALDTAEPATHLSAYYEKRGYRLVGEADWTETNYRSVILSKSL